MDKSKIEKIIKKIASVRVQKGLTYENMADELNITAPAYRKIETGKTNLTVERLFQISDLLTVSVSELLELNGEIFQQINNEHATGYLQKIEHFYHDNKEVYEKLLKSKDDQIALLERIIDNKFKD